MTPTPPPRSGHFGLALMLAALATLGPFSIDTFLPAMPAIGASLGASQVAMQQALTVLRDEKEVKESGGLVTPFAERQRLVGKPEWDALEKRYT